MRAFTILESAIVLVLISLIAVFGISFLAVNRDFFYLRDSAKNFSVALNTVSDMGQKVIQKDNNYFCAYGIYFPSSTSYETLAFSTTTKLCEYLFSSSTLVNDFLNNNLTSKKFILQNQEIVTSTVMPSLSLNFNFKPNYRFRFSTSSPSCESSLTPRLLFLYVYSYSDLFFMYQGSGSEWQKIDANQMYICLEKVILDSVKERYTIKINKLGQISFER